MKKYLYISLGAMIGAILRFSISIVAASLALPFFAGTLIVNMSGAFGAGLLLAKLKEQDVYLRNFLVTGLLGGFTTFSLLAYEQYVLVSSGDYIIFGVYSVINMFGGMTLAMFGYKAGGIRS
ncbi:fluoride efflux transporter CrcB [Salinicoccus sesuvii]